MPCDCTDLQISEEFKTNMETSHSCNGYSITNGISKLSINGEQRLNGIRHNFENGTDSSQNKDDKHNKSDVTRY